MAAAAGIFLSIGLYHMTDDATEFLSSVTSRLHSAPYESIIVDYLSPLQKAKGFKYVLIVKDRFLHKVHLEAV
eukprot:m51a1_g1585 hypothetical protein (73) ;mRNA; f:125308-126339